MSVKSQTCLGAQLSGHEISLGTIGNSFRPTPPPPNDKISQKDNKSDINSGVSVDSITTDTNDELDTIPEKKLSPENEFVIKARANQVNIEEIPVKSPDNERPPEKTQETRENVESLSRGVIKKLTIESLGEALKEPAKVGLGLLLTAVGVKTGLIIPLVVVGALVLGVQKLLKSKKT